MKIWALIGAPTRWFRGDKVNIRSPLGWGQISALISTSCNVLHRKTMNVEFVRNNKLSPHCLGDIADKRFHLMRSMLTFRGLSVCLSVWHVRSLCSNGKRYQHGFVHTIATRRSQIVLKLGLHRSTSSSPNFSTDWSTSHLLIWASKKFHRKLLPNG